MPVELWRKAHTAAEQAGLSLSGYLTQLVDRDELDPATGAPVWAGVVALPGLELSSDNPSGTATSTDSDDPATESPDTSIEGARMSA